jgi:hypothetical protein
MLKRLFIILILLNIFPFVYHKHFLGVHTAQAGDFLASEDGWGDPGGGDGDGDGDGDDDDDDNCPNPGSTTSDPVLIDEYISNGAKWATYEVTTTDNCTGASSTSRYNELVDDCTNPSYIDESESDAHDYYLSGDEVYAKITHTTYNSCNQLSTSYDEDRYMPDETSQYQDALYAYNSGEQTMDFKANIDPTEHTGANGEITRNASPEWMFYREKFLSTGTAEWTAFFSAVHVKDGSTWKFQSCTYNNSGLTAGVVPLCQEYTITMNSTTINISTDKLTAKTTINYTVVHKIECLFHYGFPAKTFSASRDILTTEGVN